MRWIVVSLITIGLWSSLGQAQSIPQDVRQLKEDVRRIMERLDSLNVPPPGGAPPPHITRAKIAVFNPSRTPIVVIEPDRLGHGHVSVADNERNARVELIGMNTGRGFIRVNGYKVHDYAELFELATRQGIRVGSVLAYDWRAGGLVPASMVNAKQVVGVVSGAGGLTPGMVIGSRKDGSQDLPVAISGVIYVRVSREAGPVEPGDLLVPSSVEGVGMRARNPPSAAGMVFGKALEPWSKAGEGLVLMLVMNR